MDKKDIETEKVQEVETKTQEEALQESCEGRIDNASKLEKEDKQTETDHQQLLQDEKDKFLRLFAEFENYKKRTARERLELFKTAGQEVVLAMLPILDDFERSVEQLTKSGNDDFLKGVTLIYKKFFDTLKSKGLETIEVASGEIFDAEQHEAVTQMPAPNEDMKNKVIDVVDKGYKLGDKIIRYPKVVVGN